MDVLIVDSSREIIKRLRELLSAEPAISTIHEATNYREASSLLKSREPAAVLMDTNLPDNKSVMLAKKIRSGMKNTTIVAMAIRLDEQLVFQYRLLGVEHIYDKYHEFEKIPGVVADIAGKGPET